MKKTILAALGLMLVVTFIGCNTIKGLGDDISTVGGWMTKGAEKVEEAN